MCSEQLSVYKYNPSLVSVFCRGRFSFLFFDFCFISVASFLGNIAIATTATSSMTALPFHLHFQHVLWHIGVNTGLAQLAHQLRSHFPSLHYDFFVLVYCNDEVPIAGMVLQRLPKLVVRSGKGADGHANFAQLGVEQERR